MGVLEIDGARALTVHQAGAVPGCEAQHWVSRGSIGQGGIRKAASAAGLSQDTESVLKTLCPFAPPSIVSWLANMTLQHSRVIVSLSAVGLHVHCEKNSLGSSTEASAIKTGWHKFAAQYCGDSRCMA